MVVKKAAYWVESKVVHLAESSVALMVENWVDELELMKAELMVA